MEYNKGDKFDHLSNRARVELDKKLRETGGGQLVELEHRLRLFNTLLELRDDGYILPQNPILVETAQLLQDAMTGDLAWC